MPFMSYACTWRYRSGMNVRRPCAQTSPCFASLTGASASRRASSCFVQINDQLRCSRLHDAMHARSCRWACLFLTSPAAGGHVHAAGELPACHGVEPRRNETLLHRSLAADTTLLGPRGPTRPRRGRPDPSLGTDKQLARWGSGWDSSSLGNRHSF
jgi:hypothetical protein